MIDELSKIEDEFDHLMNEYSKLPEFKLKFELLYSIDKPELIQK